MGLTVSRKTAKNLAVRRKNERILTVSRKKMLTVKKNSNHKIRARDLLLSLMCYVCYTFYVFWQELARSDTPTQLLTMETFVPFNI